jgi:hypothetical protein
VTDYIRRFWTWLVSLAGIAALYVGALAAKLTKYFWIVVILSVVLAGIKPTMKLLRESIRRIRTYPALLQQMASAETRIEQLEAERKGFTDRIRDAKSIGFAEAWAEIEGAVRANQMDPPQIVGITEESGDLALVAEYGDSTKPVLNAWFTVQGITGTAKGTAKVMKIDEVRKIVLLAPVGSIDTPFWNHLTQRVSYDDSPPQNAVLARFVPEFEQASPDRIADGGS